MAFLSHRIKISERGGQRHDGESLKISILFLMAEGNLQISRRCGLVVANFCSDAINGSKWPYLVSQAINSIDSEIYGCMYAWCHMDSTWPASQPARDMDRARMENGNLRKCWFNVGQGIRNRFLSSIIEKILWCRCQMQLNPRFGATAFQWME